MHLRWVLSCLGVVFVIGLFWWERRKQQPRSRAVRSLDPDSTPRNVAHPPVDWTVPRATVHPLPVVELADDGRPDNPFGPVGEVRPSRRESLLAEPPVLVADERTVERTPRSADSSTSSFAPPEELPPAARVAPTGRLAPPENPAPPEDPAPAEDLAPAEDPAPAEERPARSDCAALRLEWPDESERQIVAVRVLPLGERFGGRAVRQALVGEGFAHGPLGIFHRALADGRVVISCASLTKPGNFSLASMDSQRYSGLNLFVVLPGPLSASASLEDLVTVTRRLASRLGGTAQDERGQGLDATRIAELKATLAGTGYLPRTAVPTQVPGEHVP
jgi:FtsZ-interacting cell division protein ZipA